MACALLRPPATATVHPLSLIHIFLKPGAKFVLDIPDVGSPECTICALIEAYLGRADQFDLTRDAFERLLDPYFTLQAREKVGPMVQYFVRRKA